jgi:phosphatidate cytidylyltransferase
MVAVPLVVGVILYAPHPLHGPLIAAVSLVAACEEIRLLDPRAKVLTRGAVILLAAWVPTAFSLMWLDPLGVVAIAMLGAMATGLLPAASFGERTGRAMAALLTVVHTGVLLGSLVLLWDGPSVTGARWVLLVVALAWATDLGAYVVGRAIGRRAIAPHISPAKTLAGFWGGIFAALAVGLAFQMTGVVAVPLGVMATVAAVSGGLAQAGDLFESLLKRDAGVRHSGSLFGAQGGVLDVIDGICFVAPLFYVIRPLLVT